MGRAEDGEGPATGSPTSIPATQPASASWRAYGRVTAHIKGVVHGDGAATDSAVRYGPGPPATLISAAQATRLAHSAAFT